MSARGESRVRPFVLLTLVGALAFCVAAPCDALASTSVGPATWAGLRPADDSAVIQARPTISVEAFDPIGIKQRDYAIFVDGVALRPGFSYRLLGWQGSVPILDRRYATLTASIRYDLPYGLHGVQARVTNNAGIQSEHAWSFSRAGTPALDEPIPAPGSVTTQRTPTLSVRVLSNSMGLTGSFTIDAVTVPGVFNPATGVFSAVLAGPLALDAVQHVTVSATNALGFTATFEWEFTVDVRLPLMPVTGCKECHADQPGAHPMTDCDACHSLSGPLGEEGVSGAPHSPYYIYSPEYECTFCHARSFPSVPPLHQFSPDPYHVSTYACTECHSRNLDSEHNRATLTCLTCHASTDPQVVAAIKTGSTACDSCHVVHGDLGALHTYAAMDVSCQAAGCHVNAIINQHEQYVGEGNRYPEYQDACALCHANTDPERIPSDATVDCSDCHPGEPHPANLHETTVNCDACHAIGNVASVHGDNCGSCHPTPANDLVTWNMTCQQAGCHAAPLHPAMDYFDHQFEWMGTYYGTDCWSCHEEEEWGCTPTCHPHVYERVPPATTSNVQPDYVGTATILLTATDAGEPIPSSVPSGVKATYYRLDGGAIQIGATVVVPPPSSGSTSHKLEYWSMDWALNTEIHHVVTFTVSAS